MSLAACISASSCRRLDHPAAANDRVGADDRAGPAAACCSRSRMKKRSVSSKPTGLRRDAALAEEVGDELQRLLILVPGADLGRDRQALGDRRPLEEGRDDDRVAVRRDDRGGQPLRAPPLDAGEIVEARPGFDDASRRCRSRASARCALAIRCSRSARRDRRRDRDRLQRFAGGRARPGRTAASSRRLAPPRLQEAAPSDRSSFVLLFADATVARLRANRPAGATPMFEFGFPGRREAPRHARDDGACSPG